MIKPSVYPLALAFLVTAPQTPAEPATTLADLGEKLFFDTQLSEPAGQSCASCHLPGAGFADPDRELPVSRGVHPDRFGERNTPSTAYALYSPAFHFDAQEAHYVGGQFWDGRAATLEEQAKGPFLNPVEMANPDPGAVVAKVRRSGYASEFDKLFGPGSLDEVEGAFERIAAAIAAFERSAIFHPFSSKYDYFLAGKVELSAQEKLGLQLFNAEDKGNCAACHPSQPDPQGNPPLFTDFTYDNLGVPRNPTSPFYTQHSRFNPQGTAAIDLGLAKTTGRDEDKGKFKVSTLRNITLTPPYMHNGVFQTLQEVVDFYNTRDTRRDWGVPEVRENVNTEELGNLGLTNAEVAAILAFMETLTDGYALEAPSDQAKP
jgi:cytochrome c peroxidase